MHPSDYNSPRSSSSGRGQPRPSSSIEHNNPPVDVNRLSTWYENLEEYEGNLEEMATATLDQTFQDEMQHVNQWFGYLSDAEKTATLYTLLQHSSQVQIRFFIHLLQEMRKPKPNPLNTRASERASSLMNLNRRQPSISHQHRQQQQIRDTTIGNRHSFALGDTEQVNRLFGRMGTDWLGEDSHPLPNMPTPVTAARSTNLRPKSVMELGATTATPEFSNSWLLNNQRQSSLFHDTNVIERPRSADISSWTLPTTSQTWKPMGTDLWKNDGIQHTHPTAPPTTTATTAFSGADTRKKSYGQFLTPQNIVRRSSSFESSSDVLGYGSDHNSDISSQRYHNRPAASTQMKLPNTAAITTTTNASSTIAESSGTKEEPVDMELLKDVTAWFRSMRLHKYNSLFEHMRWQDIVKMDDQDLQAKGVAALGARRKMLKVFENIKEHCRVHHIVY